MTTQKITKTTIGVLIASIVLIVGISGGFLFLSYATVLSGKGKNGRTLLDLCEVSQCIPQRRKSASIVDLRNNFRS